MKQKIMKAYKLLTDKIYRFHYLSERGVYDKLTDEEYLRKKYRTMMGRELKLDPPRTYNEKLQWLKLYNRRPEYSRLVDKFEVKQIVASLIGAEYVIPNLGVWDSFDQIDFDTLPDQFVLKCTHDSGGLVICKDKSKLDLAQAKRKIEHSLKTNFYMLGREWPYKHVKPRIMAEAYMEDSQTRELRDYKFFVFDGVCKTLFVASSRYKEGDETRFDFFDMDFKKMDIRHGHPNADTPIEKPQCFDEMRWIAEKLGQGHPHVRIDLYEVDGKVYFGEYTFFHHSGFVPFDPEEWDQRFGEWITLPERTTEDA